MSSAKVWGKVMAGGLVLSGVIAGAALYYLQIYAFYEEVPPTDGADVTLLTLATGEAGPPEPISYSEFRAIDSDSSPIRFRGCFETDLSLEALSAAYLPFDTPIPRNAPGWFSCFDAAAIADALKAGTARAYLGQKNVGFGVDQVVVVTEDGRGFIWHELNDCGEKAYDGTVIGEDCPPREDFD